MMHRRKSLHSPNKVELENTALPPFQPGSPMKPSQQLSTASTALLLMLSTLTAKADIPALTHDFTQPEAGEVYPGGKTSHTRRIDKWAYSHPTTHMTAERKLDFTLGKALFKRLWASAPTTTQAADGLGPLFNARACLQCHKGNGRGKPQKQTGETDPSFFLQLSLPSPIKPQKTTHTLLPEPVYGHQLQPFAIRGLPGEGDVQITYESIRVPLADDEIITLRKPHYEIIQLNYGQLHPDTMMSPRIAPPLIGLGLLGAIHPQDLEALADPDDNDQNGISGRINIVWSQEHHALMPGRFGWKASTASINEQTQKAFFLDMGLSTPLFNSGAGECTPAQTDCRFLPDGNSPQYENLEAHSDIVHWTALYTRNLAVPQRRKLNDPRVLNGKQLFYQSGCTGCHHPKFITRKDPTDPEHARQLIWPYTDLLLHDMGEGLADHRPVAGASGREWRTAPLWGIGLSKTVNGNDYFLHDGRARTLLEAILWHGGEAASSRKKVVNMTRTQRADLILFIESL